MKQLFITDILSFIFAEFFTCLYCRFLPRLVAIQATNMTKVTFRHSECLNKSMSPNSLRAFVVGGESFSFS